MARLTENLPILRMKLSLSQAQLAELLGVSRQTIVNTESGKRKITWSMFITLVLLFYRNEQTKTILTAFNIYTDELDEVLLKFFRD